LNFPGQHFDEASGLHYNYFRDYEPSIGRYVESDPIGLVAGLNTYAYVGGAPLSSVDPRGESAIGLGGSAGAALGGTIGSLFPGPGTAIGAAIGFGVGAAATYWICSTQASPDKKQCSKASKWQLAAAGISDEHEFKEDHAGRGRIAQYDICACDDGTIILRKAGQCGRSGPTIPTDTKWK
jgi:RHS repeat-associated protein